MDDTRPPGPAPSPVRRLLRWALATEEALAEGLTMALYVSLSLLAVTVALPSSGPAGDAGEVALLVVFTSTGLILAHLVAFRLSSRILHAGSWEASEAAKVGAQVLGGAAVTVVAALPVLLLGPALGTTVAEALLLGIVALAGLVVARQARMPPMRALGYVLVVVLVVVGVLAVKSIAGH
jgi:hypothetical protein